MIFLISPSIPWGIGHKNNKTINYLWSLVIKKGNSLGKIPTRSSIFDLFLRQKAEEFFKKILSFNLRCFSLIFVFCGLGRFRDFAFFDRRFVIVLLLSLRLVFRLFEDKTRYSGYLQGQYFARYERKLVTFLFVSQWLIGLLNDVIDHLL